MSNQKILQSQLKQIEQSTDAQLIKYTDELRKNAEPAVLPSLLERWNQTPSETLKDKLAAFFMDINDQSTVQYFIEAVQSEYFKENKQDLLSILWQSKLDSSEYFEELVDLALESDVLTILEISTVIENYETVFREDLVMDIIYRIQEHMDEEQDENRQIMLLNLKQIISELPLE